jgi:large subunit ribosomal protein L9
VGWGIDYGKAYSSGYVIAGNRGEITLTSISKLGSYKANIKLHSDVTADVEVEVVSL